MKKGLIVLIILSLVIFAVACQKSSKEGGSADTESAEQKVSEELLLDYALNIGFMKGHLRSALANLEEDGSLAEVHTKHPVDEDYYSKISKPLEEADSSLAEELTAAFEDLPDQVDAGNIEAVIGLLDKALVVLVPEEEFKETSFQASVIRGMLGDVEHEYEEAVSGKGVLIEEEEYQDAFGFFKEAHDLYESIENEVSAHENEEIEKQFDELKKAFLGVTLKGTPVLPVKVKAAVEEIERELSKI